MKNGWNFSQLQNSFTPYSFSSVESLLRLLKFLSDLKSTIILGLSKVRPSKSESVLAEKRQVKKAFRFNHLRKKIKTY